MALSKDDWTAAALSALGERGLAAVAIEPLASRLGTTKGSFYWHFRDRDELIVAALGRWEQIETEQVIAIVERADPEPRARLELLLRSALEDEAGGAVDVALLAEAADPRVRPVVARVTTRRLDYLSGLFRAAGLPPAEARRRARVAYGTYLGAMQLRRAAPQLSPAPREREGDVRISVELLLGDLPASGRTAVSAA